MWYHTLKILALRRLSQESSCKFEVNLGCLVRTRQFRVTLHNPVSKAKKKQRRELCLAHSSSSQNSKQNTADSCHPLPSWTGSRWQRWGNERSRHHLSRGSLKKMGSHFSLKCLVDPRRPKGLTYNPSQKAPSPNNCAEDHPSSTRTLRRHP